MDKNTSPQSLTPSNLSHQDAFGVRLHAKGHVVTYGERKFDRLTYTTVGYVINALLSVGAVWWVERTHGGQKMIENFGNAVKRAFKLEKAETAKMLATKSFFLAGGFLVMPPMKWLEDAKLKLVKKWDRAHYGEAADIDPQIQQSHADIENAPKQNWASILGSRVLALVPFYAGYWLLWDKKSPLAKATGEKVFVDRPIVAASRGIGKFFAKLTGNKEAEKTIADLGASHAGEMRSAIPKPGATGLHDPVHSVTPYYFISEAITSGMVAWGIYALTRVLGPILGTKRAQPVAEKTVTARAGTAAPAIEAQEVTPTETALHPKKEERPEASVQTNGAVYHAAIHSDNLGQDNIQRV